MRVIEVAYVDIPLDDGEVYRRPVITMDGEPLKATLDVHMRLGAETEILIDEHRVTEPTRVVRRGVVIAEDHGKGSIDGKIARLMRTAIIDGPAMPWSREPGLTPLEALERAAALLETATIEPHVVAHHPRCPAVNPPFDPTECTGRACG